jgi:hypothetical protein
MGLVTYITGGHHTMFSRTAVVLALLLLPALFAARIDHRPVVMARAARGTGAAEGRAWVTYTVRSAVSRGAA